MSKKIEAIQRWQAIEDQTQLKSFLDLTSFYCRFVKAFARLAQALTFLLGKR